MIEHILALRITGIIVETKDTATLVLEEISGNSISYKAGQFLTFIFDMHGREIRRSYSISSTPHVDEKMQVTVKRIRNGAISRQLLDHYHEGDILKALAPAGMFVTNDRDDIYRDIFLIAAGSGITPVFSVLKDLLYNRSARSVILIYQNHSEGETIFREALQNISKEFPETFTWIDFVSSPQSNYGVSRRLNNALLEQMIPGMMKFNPSHALFFICGPSPFMRMCQYTIMLMGFKQVQVKREFFIIDQPPPPPLIMNTEARKVEVAANHQHISFSTTFPKTILQSALDQRIALPYSCRGGRCSSCVAKCMSGEVVMSMNDVLTEEDIAHGLILTCVGYAVTDIVLSYNRQ